MRRLFVILALAATTAAAQSGRTLQSRPIRLPSENQQWTRVESPGFTIISSASESRARDVARNLEKLTAALAKVDQRLATRGPKTRVLLFTRRADSQPYFDLLMNAHRTSAPGVFISTSEGDGTMILDGTRNLIDRTVFHELIHKLLAASATRLPLWLEEGIGEYFSSAEIRGDSISLGLPVREHQSQLRKRALIPMDQFFTMTYASPQATDGLFYSQAWGVVDWMIRQGRPKFYAFLSDVEGGMAATEAIERNFKVSPDAVARGIVHHDAPPPSITVRLDDGDLPITTVAMTRADALYELGRFLTSLQVSRADAEKHLRAALEIDPNHARALAALGTLRAREKNYEEAAPFFEKALAADPNDAQVHIEYAEMLLRDELGTFAGNVQPGPQALTRSRRARKLAERGLELGGDASRAKAAIGTSYLVEPNVTAGIKALEEARALDPARYDIALNLYALYLRTGDAQKAQKLFDERFASAPEPQLTSAARSITVRERLSGVNALIKENKIDQAMTMIDELIAIAPDDAGRFELNEQKRQLAKIAEINRQLLMYNEAVSLLNRGDRKRSLAIAQELQKIASDPDILNDAKDLEARIRRMR